MRPLPFSGSTSISFFNRYAAIPLAVCLLSACGGGGGNQPVAELGHAEQAEHTAGGDSVTIHGDMPSDDGVMADLSQTMQLWSDASTWGGSVPVSGDVVTVPRGQSVILDQDVDLASLTINGSLICADQDLAISARWIMVHGLLQCGTEEAPHQYALDIELVGSDKTESTMGMGTKVLAAMHGGVISLHGEERTSWLMLDGTAYPGDTQINVEHATNWRQGDTIVIASTSDDMNQAEVRTISDVEGSTVSFENPLSHRHFGKVQVFDNGTRTWEVDTRAEVGLLSRNIRIRGDQTSEALRFGGHVMIMEGAAGLIAGVEFFQMGQEGLLGRYPFHWHLANNVDGQYIRNSSIRRSYNRCITIHGTHQATVADNVCYDHVGHGFFLEDGSETHNTFDRNLGLLTRKPAASVALIPSDTQGGEAGRGPSTFWISNPNNTFVGNAAAGSDGLGFWYDTDETVSGESAGLERYKNVNPMTAAFGEFRDNRVHSSNMAFSTCTLSSGPAGYLPPTQAEFINLTVFSGGDGAVWPCEGNQLFTEMKITDTGHSHHAGFVAPRPVTVKDSLFVANSELSDDGSGRMRSAIGIYDYGVDMHNTHFVNFNSSYGGSYIFGARDADVRFTSNPISNITLDDSYLYYDRRKSAELMQPSAWGAVIHDTDGSLGLPGGSALVADHPLMTDSTCTDLYGNGRLCGNRYGRVELDFSGQQNLPPITHMRSDGRSMVATPLEPRAHYQSVVSVNHDRYHYAYSFSPSVFSKGKLGVELDFLHDGDTVVLEFTNLPVSTTVASVGYIQAGTLAQLKQGAGKMFFRDGESLFLKLRATGATWQAQDRVALRW